VCSSDLALSKGSHAGLGAVQVFAVPPEPHHGLEDFFTLGGTNAVFFADSLADQIRDRRVGLACRYLEQPPDIR